MRPQGFGQVGNGLEDLGWNDMGFEPPKPADAARDEEHDAFGEEVVEHPRAHHPTGLTPIQSPVHDQQAEIAERFNGADDSGEAEIDEIDEIDETAELYEAEAEDRPAPAQAVVPPIAVEPIVSAPARSPAPRHAPRARAVPGTK